MSLKPKILRLMTVATLAVAASPVSAAVPLAAKAAAPEAPGFSIDEVVVAPSPSGPSLNSVLVRIELLSPEARASLNGKSALLTLDDDCNGHRVRLRRVRVFREALQGGTPSEASAPADWLPFINHSYAAQIAEAICARRGELIATAARAAEAPTGGPPPRAPGPSPSPAPIAPSVATAPSPPVGSLIQLAEAISTPPAPGPLPTPPAPARPAPAHPAPAMTPSPKPTPVTSQAEAPPQAQAPSGGILVQVLSSTSEAELERAKSRLRQHLGPEADRLTFSTGRAVVRGVTRYRARIGPFASTPEARAFCVTVRKTGFPCLLVADGDSH